MKKKAAKKAAKIEGVKQLGKEISKTNCFFIQLKAIGCCDENGRTQLGIEYGPSKIIAKPDKPLALVQGLLCEMMRGMHYSTREAAEADVNSFKEWAEGLQVN